MYPFERFTERAKKVLTLAQEEAERSHHSYIGTEHLLLGLLREGEGLAAKVLNNLGVEIGKVRQTIEAVLGRNERILIQQIIPTSRVKKVIEISFDQAKRMGHNYVGTEHLLLGLLIEGEGIAAKVLVDLGATLEKVRSEIERLLGALVEPAEGLHRGGEVGRSVPILPEVRRLLGHARATAAGAESPAMGLDQLLEAIAATPAGIEAVARLLDLKRIAAMKQQAVAARDFDAAAKHRREEQRAHKALKEAVTAWRAGLKPPGEPAAGSGAN